MIILLKFIEIVTNIECAVFFINEKYFRKLLFDENVIKMIVSINVKNIKNVHKKCNIYVLFDLYLNDESKSIFFREYFWREIHVVKNLKCKFFLEMNILKAKQIIINLINKIMIIFICRNLIVFIKIALKSNARIRRVIHFKNQIVISLKSIAQISIYMKNKLLSDNKIIFLNRINNNWRFFLKQLNDFYTHVCHNNVTEVHVRNNKNMTIKISRRARLKTLIEYETKKCYQIDDEYHEVTMISNIQNMKIWFQNVSNDFTTSEFFHELKIRVWFQNIMNNFTMFESFHDEFSSIFTASESIHESDFSKFSNFFTIIREI